jgi:hypothetical protein
LQEFAISILGVSYARSLIYYLSVIATVESVLVCDLTSLPEFVILSFVEVMQEVYVISRQFAFFIAFEFIFLFFR